MQNPVRIGTKVYLRPLDQEDAPRIVPWFNDPEVSRTIAMYLPLNRLGEEAFIAKLYQSDHDIVLGIAARESDALVGVTGLHQIDYKNRHANFGITIGEPIEWGKGYGTEATALMVEYAFETLNLNRVRLLVFEYNERGQRTYERVGFRREGVLRQEHFHAGRYWDTFTMAILRAEWDAVKQRLGR